MGKMRRETPLFLKLSDRIRRSGPISVFDYMTACLQDPEHGYYRHSSAIGAKGDFVTAPEISQIFGELIGLWCAVVWQQMGSPQRVKLIELGPGRGTMMKDALRAIALVEGLSKAATLHLIEVSHTLKQQQEAALSSDPCAAVSWHSSLSQALSEPAPAIIIANEYLDTLPVQQIVWRDGQWRERQVSLSGDDELAFELGNASCDAPRQKNTADAADGEIFEQRDGYAELAGDIARAAASNAPIAGVFIDYGHESSGFGDTLQATRAHRRVSPFERPGESDLTANVDFEAFAMACSEQGLAVDGPVTQAEFLGRLGIIERASRLMSANPSKAAQIEAGVARLMAPNGMGTRFKAIGIRSPSLPPLPGFE